MQAQPTQALQAASAQLKGRLLQLMKPTLRPTLCFCGGPHQHGHREVQVRWHAACAGLLLALAAYNHPGLPPSPLTSTESRFSRVTMLLVLVSTVLPTIWVSQVTGTPAALKIFFTASAISGPMPAIAFGDKFGSKREIAAELRRDPRWQPALCQLPCSPSPGNRVAVNALLL